MTAALLMAVTSVSAAHPVASASEQGQDPYPCRGYGGMNVSNPVPDLDKDLFTWSVCTRTKVGNGRHDIDWTRDPYRQDSWRTWLHALQWTGAYVIASTRGPERLRDPRAIDGAVAIAQDWVRDHRYPWPTGPGAGNATHPRANALLCLRRGLIQLGRPVPRWLDTSLLQHADWLKKNTWADHNVGTDQTLAIMGIGCTLGRRDLRDGAVAKLSRDITRVIDDQGANNEQAIGYARYNYALWGYVGDTLTTCGVTTSAARTIQARRAGLQTFLVHSLRPDGTYHQLGDTQTERPVGGSPREGWRA